MIRREFWARFQRNKLAMSGLFMVGGMFLVSFFAPWLAPYDPGFIDIKSVLMPPSAEHWLGTDPLGRDVPSRIIYGAQVSLKVVRWVKTTSSGAGSILTLASDSCSSMKL